jgi:hypothetical protein
MFSVLSIDALRRARAVEHDIDTLLVRFDATKHTAQSLRATAQEIRALAIRVQMASVMCTASHPRPLPRWLQFIVGFYQ